MDWCNRDICRGRYDCCWRRGCLCRLCILQQCWVGCKLVQQHLDRNSRCFYVAKSHVKDDNCITYSIRLRYEIVSFSLLLLRLSSYHCLCCQSLLSWCCTIIVLSM